MNRLTWRKPCGAWGVVGVADANLADIPVKCYVALRCLSVIETMLFGKYPQDHMCPINHMPCSADIISCADCEVMSRE